MNGPYERHNGFIGVRLAYVGYGWKGEHDDSLRLISYSAYKKRALRSEGFRLREAHGAGNDVLLSWDNVATDWQSQIRKAFGDPEAVKNPLEEYFEIDPQAVAYYNGASPTSFRFEDGAYPTPDQADRYTLNASVLNAFIKLKEARETSRKMRGSSLRGLWPSLITDLSNFNDFLLRTRKRKHTLPLTNKIKARLKKYQDESYISLIDGRAKNTNAQKVTQAMLDIWRDIYSGQRGRKPDYQEVSTTYDLFLAGLRDVVNCDTSEVYDPLDPEYQSASKSTVYLHQSSWQRRAGAQLKRSGDRQKFKSKYEPYHKLIQPEFAGSIISIDDRQPPFKTLAGNRIWFYIGIDLGSEAITTWVHGESKEGIILEFYRQMVRQYHDWGVPLPYELEGESSLNSSFTDTFLKDGAMFPKVRIEANNARGKRIEAHFRQLRYGIEKNRVGWIARPHARDESNQKAAEKVPQLPIEQIVHECLRDIVTWNNMPHSNQQLHPGMSRWDVFLDKQHPQPRPYNWPSILAGLGKTTRNVGGPGTSMQAARIVHQGKSKVVGQHGQVATGTELINIMKQIESEDVEVRWLEGSDGQILKSLVYDKAGTLVCELMDELAYHKATLEQTPQCAINRAIMSAYANTVTSFIRESKNEITQTLIINKEVAKQNQRFQMPGIRPAYTPPAKQAKELPTLNGFEAPSNPVRTRRISDRF